MADADKRATTRTNRQEKWQGPGAGAVATMCPTEAVGMFLMWEMTMRKSEKAAARGAADLQAQLAERLSQQFGHSGETYGRLFAAMRDEFTGFVQRRLDANTATMRAWSECRSFNDMLALQQSWLQCAVDHYVDQGNRVFETCRLAASDIADTAQTTMETERPATERKSAGHKHTESALKQAA